MTGPVTVGAPRTPWESGADATVYNPTGIGDNIALNERAVIAIAGRNGSGNNRTINSVTIAGQACSAMGPQKNSSGTVVALYLGPLGVGGTIEIQLSGTWTRMCASVWPTKFISNPTPAFVTSASNMSILDAKIDCPADGAVFAVCQQTQNSNLIWYGNITGNQWLLQPAEGGCGSGAANAFAAAQSQLMVQCDSTGTGSNCLAAAAMR